MRVDPAKRVVTGTLRVEFRPDLPTDHLRFRLWPNAPPQAAEGAKLTVSDVKALDDHRLRVVGSDPTTLLMFVRPGLQPGDRISVSLAWRLRLPGAVLDRLASGKDMAMMGSFFPILPWQPGVGWATDPPTTTLAEAGTSPTADFDVSIRTIPADLTVLATGEEVDPGHWRAEAVRDFAVAVGRFRLARTQVSLPDRVDVTVGVLEGVQLPPEQLGARIAHTLADLSSLYGPYPWPTFTMAILPNVGRSGIEYPNLVFEGPDGIARVTTHELAHQWFYSLVGNDQAAFPWVDEALATYAAGERDGFLPFFANAHFPGVAADHVGYPMAFWDDYPDLYEPGVYFNGVKALLTLGPPDQIDCALRSYVAEHAYGIATSDDLLDALSVQFPSARKDLQPFGIP
jgi:hypothetical protein